MDNYKTDRNQNYRQNGLFLRSVDSLETCLADKTSPKRVVQNGAIASLVAPPTPSSSSREATPTTSFSPPSLSPVSRGAASRVLLNSPPHHLHLPSYRFVDEDSR